MSEQALIETTKNDENEIQNGVIAIYVAPKEQEEGSDEAKKRSSTVYRKLFTKDGRYVGLIHLHDDFIANPGYKVIPK